MNPLPASLDPTIAAYIEASNAGNTDALLGCFTPGAVVVDEGRTHRGAEEIRRWLAQTRSAYAFTFEVIDVAEPASESAETRESVVTCRVSGTFEGSPIQLRLFFTLEGDKIAALTIRE